MILFSRNHVQILNANLLPNQQKLGFLKNLAKANGYSYLVTADGGKFILKHKVSEESEQDQYEYSYIGGDGKVRNFENEHTVFSIDFWNSCNFNQAQNYLYDQRLLAILDKLNFSPSQTDPYDIMQKAVLLSPYSACQHSVTEEQRKTFMDQIYKLNGDEKINTLNALKSLSSNFIAEENKAERNLSFKANDEIYFDHSRGKDVASAPQESGRVFAENKFNEFKKKAEALPAEGVSDRSIAPTDYVEFHKIENYFDEDEFPLDQADSAGSVSSKDRTAVVFFHANKKENSQTVISGEAVNKLTKVALECCKFIEYSVFNHFDDSTHLDPSREELLKDLKDNYKQISTGHTIPKAVSTEKLLKYLHDDGVKHCNDDKKARFAELLKSRPEIGNLIVKLTNFKIANDFLECKIESQEQPINPVRKQEEVKLINDLIIASKEKLSPENDEDKFDKFIKVFNYNFGKVGNAKLNSEEQYDKKYNSKTDPQYHSAKNIFQAGISIRRDKEHPHLVDIVRVISEGEDLKKSPNIQFVAIKNKDGEGNEIALTIKRNNHQEAIAETITNKVFFRKVVLANDGEVRFSSNIYYYDSAGKRKHFNINQIIKNDKRNEFLENLGMLKIRATNVKIANNQIEVTGSKMSALNDAEFFYEQSLIDKNLSKELEDVRRVDGFVSPLQSSRLDTATTSRSTHEFSSPREPSPPPRPNAATSPRCAVGLSPPLEVPPSLSTNPETSPRRNAGPLSSRPSSSARD